MPSFFIPTIRIDTKVGADTSIWWREIGRCLVSFTEIEQGALDWAVYFSENRGLWKLHFMDDLKKILQVLRRSTTKAGSHRLEKATREAMKGVFEKVEVLVQPRNDIAHMRLIFAYVPLGEEDEWIRNASHVSIRKREGARLVRANRDLEWIRGVTKSVIQTTRDFDVVMRRVANEIKLPPPGPSPDNLFASVRRRAT